jgi:hypothetical protein
MSNPERKQMVRAAVARAQGNGEEVTIENVAQYLPGGANVIHQWTGEGYEEDFGLDADDLAPWFPQNAMIAETPDGRALAPHTEEADDPSLRNESVVEVVEENRAADESTITEVESARSRDELPAPTQYELGELRIVLARAKDRQTTARGKFSIARDRYLRAVGAQGPTPDELLRQNARESNQYLADIKSGKVQRPVYSRIGASVVDHMAAAMRGSGQRAGGGRSYSRGAYPASRRGQKVS